MVIHNDVAELYWNVLGEYFEEDIKDFQVKIHLPGEDNDVRIWTHGPLTGVNQILDNKTLYFRDTNIDSYTPETIRIMFNKDLVPLGTKKSNVNGKENILKYETMMADTANRDRENQKLELENEASEAVLELEEYPRIYYYNRALELVNSLDEDSEQKQNFLDRIETTKELVNEDWKESLKYELEFLTDDSYRYLTRSRLDDFKEEIQEGFDETTKEAYMATCEELEVALTVKQANLRKTFIILVTIFYILLTIVCTYKLVKIIKERRKFKGQYYRDFPSEDNPNVLEYLMKRRSTNLGFSATILNLIAKKVITYEKKTNEEDISLKLANKDYTGTKAEIIVLEVLFNVVGRDDKCKISALKNFGKNQIRAKALISKIDKFKKETKTEIEAKKYFKGNTASNIFKILIFVNYVFSMCMTLGVFYGLENCGKQVLIYMLGVTIISSILFIIANKDKNRTPKGKEEYSKWLAHKRFLKDFSKFDEKELPEIVLWEKYLVTATVLGCANKVEKQMKMHITDASDVNTHLLLYQSINLNLTREVNTSVKTAISTSSTSISTSSYSSGGGFGGGSSGIGGRRRPEAAVEVVSNKNLV